METTFPEIFTAKNKMVTSGLLIEAAEKYFAPAIRTIDFDGIVTTGKDETMQKMKSFFESIEKINEIILYRMASFNDVTFAEFTFNFKIKDGRNIFWHEIVRSLWKNGQITEEQYFIGNNRCRQTTDAIRESEENNEK
jgi:hypothetical protein